MISTDSCEQKGASDECNADTKVKSNVSTSQRGLVSEENRKNSFNFSQKKNFFNLSGMQSPSVTFQRIAVQRDEVSRTVPSSGSLRERFSKLFSKKIEWESLQKMGKVWIRDPFNIALFIWILIVAISGAILFLVMTGMLNKAIPKKSQRDTWFEVNNQILNALFTLMCLYQHPKRIYHLVLLCKWNPDAITKLRKVYCKNGTYKPHEWAHMMVVVILLHINCFAQYGLCALNLGYRRSNRPAIGVGICISFAIVAPALAGMYSTLSPLGKDYGPESDEEAQIPSTSSEKKSFERRFSFAIKDNERVPEINPVWSGGIFDFWDDISIAYLSLFCTFCVFGWNMERLGFGNMYVHIATFLLFCLAPFFIFNLAAVNIDNEAVREALGITGLCLCLFGLLYGGFWRIQMRKRFNLPANNFCCNKATVTDCALWFFCCWCSLAQEVRTGNSYDIVEDKFCKKLLDDEMTILPLPREQGEFQFRTDSTTTTTTTISSPSSSREQLHSLEEETCTIPPVHSVIKREDS